MEREQVLSSVRIGVVADTHIPDRAVGLHPDLIPGLQAAGVEKILHAGDISAPAVLKRLEAVAPVTAVRGNRDLLFGHRLPLIYSVRVYGVQITMLHGHGGLLPYLRDKWYYLRDGYRLDRYIRLVRSAAHEAKVVVFGHTHFPVNLWVQGQLIFNPGSACVKPHLSNHHPSYGVLEISPDGTVKGEVIQLTGALLENRKWMPVLNR